MSSAMLIVVSCLGLILNKVLASSLRILDQQKEVNETTILKCGVESSLSAFERVSWIMIRGTEEIPLKTIERNGDLRLKFTPEMHGAQVKCRSHDRSRRQLVSVSPPYEIRLRGVQKSYKESYRKVTAKVGDEATGDKGIEIRRREGDQIEVTCTAVNINVEGLDVYMYVILVNVHNYTEIELNVSYPTEPRRRKATAQLTLTAKEDLCQVYCLARLFTHYDQRYENGTGLRSEPITVLVEPQTGVSYMYIWIAVGVGSLGWLLALGFGAAFLYKPRAVNSSNTQEPQTPKCDRPDTVSCFDRKKPASVRGATVMPLRAAQSIAAANVKLTPTSQAITPTAPLDEQNSYINLQELNELVGRRQWR